MDEKNSAMAHPEVVPDSEAPEKSLPRNTAI
jgi:hypothetical protein